MIDLEFVERLIRSVDDSSIDSVEIERGGTRIRIAKSPPTTVVSAPAGAEGAPAQAAPSAGAAPQVQPAGSAPGDASQPGGVGPNESSPSATAGSPGDGAGGSDLVEVTSPMVGTFYRAPAPDANPFTDVGKQVAKGDTLCIIEAMKLMNELEAELDGVVREICVENGEPVEYGQVLFRVEPR